MLYISVIKSDSVNLYINSSPFEFSDTQKGNCVKNRDWFLQMEQPLLFCIVPMCSSVINPQISCYVARIFLKSGLRSHLQISTIALNNRLQ